MAIGKLLIVDDEPRVLSGLRRSLARHDFEIATSESAVDALRLLESDDFDVVLSDNDMPGTTGTEFLRQVRDFDASLVRFMLTGKATLDLAIEAINSGLIHRFFTKPTTPLELGFEIAEAISQRALLSGSRKLLWEYRKQAAELEQLKRGQPEILKVDRDETGAVLLGDIPADCTEFLKALQDQFPDLDEAS